MKHLIIVRHGQSDYTDERRPLTPNGKEQSQVLGRKVKAFLQRERIGVAGFSSYELRARQTIRESGITFADTFSLSNLQYPEWTDRFHDTASGVIRDVKGYAEVVYAECALVIAHGNGVSFLTRAALQHAGIPVTEFLNRKMRLEESFVSGYWIDYGRKKAVPFNALRDDLIVK